MALGDMFLKVESAIHGTIKGEAQDAVHANEIQVVSWSWGMRSQTSLGGAGASGRSTLHELNVAKRVDCASTALMSVMRNNELIKKATLTVRKAGGSALEYLTITLENSRITSFDVETGAIGEEADISERLSLAFQRINIEYVPQGPDGQARGGTVFVAEIN
jgi:type VI secretion system secreted protein Hcp